MKLQVARAQSLPRNITHREGSLLQIAANDQLRECCDMLTRFGFRRKMLYLCISDEERAHGYGVFSSFLVRKKVVLRYKLVISTLRRKIFLGVCGFFLSNVGRFFTDTERLKVKRYLFSWPHLYRTYLHK